MISQFSARLSRTSDALSLPQHRRYNALEIALIATRSRPHPPNAQITHIKYGLLRARMVPNEPICHFSPPCHSPRRSQTARQSARPVIRPATPKATARDSGHSRNNCKPNHRLCSRKWRLISSVLVRRRRTIWCRARRHSERSPHQAIELREELTQFSETS